MGIVTKILGKIDVSTLKLKKGKEKKKRSLLKEVIENPEEFKLEAFMEGDEITIHIRKRES